MATLRLGARGWATYVYFSRWAFISQTPVAFVFKVPICAKAAENEADFGLLGGGTATTGRVGSLVKQTIDGLQMA